MQTFGVVVGYWTLLLGSAVLWFAQVASAADMGAGLTKDISGMRLGMSPDEARPFLKDRKLKKYQEHMAAIGGERSAICKDTIMRPGGGLNAPELQHDAPNTAPIIFSYGPQRGTEACGDILLVSLMPVNGVTDYGHPDRALVRNYSAILYSPAGAQKAYEAALRVSNAARDAASKTAADRAKQRKPSL